MRKNERKSRLCLENGLTNKLLLTTRRLNIYSLVVLPILISLLLLGMLYLVGQKIYDGHVPEVYEAVSGIIFLAVLSLSGIVQVYRRESPGPFGHPVFGIRAVITGWFIILICLTSILYLLVYIYSIIRT